MIHYLIHTSILLALSYFFYWIFLKKETFYNLNRLFLISAFVGSLLIPLVSIPPTLSFNIINVDQPLTTVLQETTVIESQTPVIHDELKKSKQPAGTPSPAPSASPNSVQKKNAVVEAVSNWNISKILWVIYLLGIAVFLLTFIIQFVILLLKKKNLETIVDGKFTIYELEDDSSPFSFFHWIFINPTLYEPETFDQILNHEKIHVSQSHWVDKLIAELAVILFWFSPFAWLYRKAITNNLEFLTDSEILDKGAERESYQMSLLKVSVPQHPLTLTTNYNESFLAQRIRMMNERKSSAKSSWKYLLTIPMILLTMASLNAIQSPSPSNNATSDIVEATPLDDNAGNDVVREKDKKKDKAKARNSNTENELENEHEPVNTTIVDGKKISDIVSVAVGDAISNISIEIGEDGNSYNFNTSNISSDQQWEHRNVKPGHWEAHFQREHVCFVWNNSHKKNGYWYSTECIDKSEFDGLPFNQEGQFSIIRDAGTMVMTGVFDDQKGSGTFELTPNEDYAAFLREQGLESPSKQDFSNLFFQDITRNTISHLMKSDYDLDLGEIIELGIHGVTLTDLKEYDSIFEKLDVDHPTHNKVVEMAIHGVTLGFVDDLMELNLSGMTVDKVIEAKIHGLDRSYIKEIEYAGYGDISISRLIEFAIHGVSTDDLEMYQRLGYGDIPANKIIEFTIHGVDANFVKGFNNIGYTDLPPNKLIEFAIHGVSPEFVREMQDQGYDDISSNKLVECRIHGVNGGFIKEMQRLGLKDVSLNKYIEFAIHGVSENYLSALRSEGYNDLSAQNLVEGRIHGVSAAYIKDLKSLGVTELTFRKLVEGKIHGVNKSFIKKARARGHSPSSLSEYINLRIHGL